MLDELVKIALVGTGRTAPQWPAVGAPLGEAMEAVKGTTAEGKLLGTVAIASAYERCGRMPTADGAKWEAAGEDALQPCTALAGQILSMLLVSAGAHKGRLVAEWLDHAIAAGRRAPHRLLPRLLDYAASRREAREQVVRVADARGQWLMRQNPAWQFGATAGGDPAADWETGNRDQRIAALRTLRERAPEQAAALIRSTWEADAAEERAVFVETLQVNLRAADEEFLEFALEDKSKRVRSAAAELLARLPESAFVRRMTERATALLQWNSPKGRSKQGTIDVALPSEPFDDSLSRDGIVEKPAEQMGRRQWWLLQILSYVPASVWSGRWGVSPEECVAAAGAGEFKDLLMRAWLAWATRLADVPWIKAILLAALAGKSRVDSLSALRALDVSGQTAIIDELIASPKTDFETLAQILSLTTAALERRAAEGAVALAEAHVASRGAGYDYALSAVLEQMSLRLAVEWHDRLVARWTGEKWESNRKSLDAFFQVLGLRRDMKREFKP